MEDISRLPKWAQQRIKDLERERETAVRALNEYVDHRTPSPFYTADLVCTGEETGPSSKRVYIQTHHMTVVHQGVELSILLRDDHIDLGWAASENTMKHVAFVPSSYQQAKLMSKEHMR